LDEAGKDGSESFTSCADDDHECVVFIGGDCECVGWVSSAGLVGPWEAGSGQGGFDVVTFFSEGLFASFFPVGGIGVDGVVVQDDGVDDV
jgi:hypothetical protein